ncbi:MAG: alpha/beta hydrolase [Pseudomonadota bacterium]
MTANRRPAIQAASDPVVLALHGSASTGKQWRTLSEHLEGYAKVVSPDLPGYGARAHDSSCRLTACVELATSFQQPLHLVAHSFGCAVALRLAYELPGHVASMTLYDPVVPLTTAKGRAVFPAGLQNLWDEARGGTPERLMQTFMDFWAGSGTWDRLHLKQRARLKEMAPGLRRDFWEAERGLWCLNRPSYRGPLSILCASNSPEVTLDMAEMIAMFSPQTQLTWLAGHGHLSPLTEPSAIARYFVKCLSGHGIKKTYETVSNSRSAA